MELLQEARETALHWEECGGALAQVTSGPSAVSRQADKRVLWLFTEKHQVARSANSYEEVVQTDIQGVAQKASVNYNKMGWKRERLLLPIS